GHVCTGRPSSRKPSQRGSGGVERAHREVSTANRRIQAGGSTTSSGCASLQRSMANRSLATEGIRHVEGPLLRQFLTSRLPPRSADIARVGGFSTAYVANVLAGRSRASDRFLRACAE